MKRQRGTDQESIRSQNVKMKSFLGVDFTIKLCTCINRMLQSLEIGLVQNPVTVPKNIFQHHTS